MTREHLFKMHEELCNKARELMKKKNADYSKDEPFDNFFVCEALKASTAENGIVTRMGDKLSRIVSVMAKGAQVNESLDDTIVDIINYAVLLRGVIVEKESRKLGDVPRA